MSTLKPGTGPTVSRRSFLGGSLAAAAGTLTVGAPGWSATAHAGVGDLSQLRPDGPADEAFWRRVRREFNIVDGMTYLNTGTHGPMPRVVFDAQVRYTREIAEDPRAASNAERTESVRSRVAAHIGADPDEIVLTRSTTEGVKLFCTGLDLKEGDEVLMSTQEHGGGFGPWHAREQRHGIRVRTVEIPSPPESVDQVVSIVERAMTPRTRVLLVSHPIFITGTLMPIKPLTEMAHRRGVLVSVDGAHALGMIDLNMHEYGIDHYTTAGQKWLLAGSGTGVAYFKRDVLPKVWSDLIRANDEEQTARKFERSGQRHMPSQWGMGDAIDFHAAIGKRTVEARIYELAAYLRDGLREIPNVTTVTSSSPELSGGLTTFYIEGVPNAVTREALLERFGIYVAGSGFHPGACRISTHIFVSRGDLDRLLEGVKYVTTNAATLTSVAR